MMASIHDELLRIIARAASPTERANVAWFEPFKEQPHLEQRASQWAEACGATGNPELFQTYLNARGLEGEAFARAISDGSVKDEARLPAWAVLFLELMESLADAETKGEAAASPFAQLGASNPFDDLLLPFVLTGARYLEQKTSSLDVSISERAQRRLLELLGARLASAIIHVVDNEMQTLYAASGLLKQMGFAPRTHLDGTLSGWLSRLQSYPALARIIAVVFQNWRDYVSEMLERLELDRGFLEREMFGGKPLGTLDNIIGDAGDLHDHGRAVALLMFDNGNRLAYKPKDLRISAAFLDLAAMLNRNGLKLPLHVRKILPRGQYAWEEWVEHQPCAEESEVERFYFRMGELIRLLQLLGARDFWLDNLIACGEQPVFIDLEMAFQQTLSPPPQLLPAELLSFNKLVETVVPIGAIAMVTPVGQGIKAEDLGALTPVREFQTPFKFSYSSPMRNLIAPQMKKNDNTKWSKTDYAPVLNGKPQRADEHVSQLIAGYKAMQESLRANRDELLADDGIFAALSDYPLRHINRDTWSCIRIINDSTRTPLLVDGFNRELFFEGLMKVALDGGRLDAKLLKITESEIESMRDTDVPLFRALPASSTLMLSNGGTLADYFYQTSLSRIRDRLASIEDFQTGEQVDFIRASLATGLHEAKWSPPAKPSETRPSPSKDFWLDKAIELGDFILSESLRSPAGELSWLGLIYHPDVDLRSVDVLRADLISGTCGLSLLFTMLFEVTGLRRFADASRAALSSTGHSIRDRHPLIRLLEHPAASSSRHVACGAYYGVGGQIYALRRSAEALKDDGLKELFAAYLEMLPLSKLCERAHLDLISGLAGLLISILPFEHEAMNEAARPIAHKLAERLLDLCSDEADLVSPYPADASLLRGLPDMREGLALCLARFQKSLDPRADENLNSMLLKCLNSLETREHDESTLWAGLSIRELSGQPFDDLLQHAEAQSRIAPEELSSQSLLNQLENMLKAFRLTLDEQYYARAVQLAEQFIERREQSGSWFPDSF
ncbi:MAG: type 2 lantipeptide synthetase LanM, partial [Acidobacteria bacterium]|nr:type 2 lantipeptide synthetase LanM [Acidobacteriota bacterium]